MEIPLVHQLSINMTPPPHDTQPSKSHPGSSGDDILNEPDWHKTYAHRIGFRDRHDRQPGLTHHGDEWDTEEKRRFLIQGKKEAEDLVKELGEHELLSVRDFMTKQEVCHLALHVLDFQMTFVNT